MARSSKPEDYIYEQKDIPQVVGYLAQKVDNMTVALEGVQQSIERLTKSFQTVSDANRSEKAIYDEIARVNKAQLDGFDAIKKQRAEDREQSERSQNIKTTLWTGVAVIVAAAMLIALFKLLGFNI